MDKSAYTNLADVLRANAIEARNALPQRRLDLIDSLPETQVAEWDSGYHSFSDRVKDVVNAMHNAANAGRADTTLTFTRGHTIDRRVWSDGFVAAVVDFASDAHVQFSVNVRDDNNVRVKFLWLPEGMR